MHAQSQRCRPPGRQSDTLGQTHLDTRIQIHGDRQTQIQQHRDRYLDTLGTDTVDTLRYRNTETDTVRFRYMRETHSHAGTDTLQECILLNTQRLTQSDSHTDTLRQALIHAVTDTFRHTKTDTLRYKYTETLRHPQIQTLVTPIQIHTEMHLWTH